jgi:serine/alanine adding enzyme
VIRVGRFSGDAHEWDAFVRRSAGWSHFHLYGWKSIMERVFGHACVYLEARDEASTLIGVLPLVRVRSALFGHYLVSMPFVNYGGPLGSPDAIRALAANAEELARHDRVKLLELRSRTSLDIPLEVSHRKITVVLDLDGPDPERVWKRLDAKVRSQIRRPQKEGITVRFGADQVVPFFNVFARHMRDLGTPTQPRRLFQAIAETFPESVWFGCAYMGSQAIACGCGFRWGDEFDGGTHKFKRQWGSRDEPLWWYHWSPAAGAKTPAPTDGAYAWGPRIWQRIPVPLATALGPRIVKFIP